MVWVKVKTMFTTDFCENITIQRGNKHGFRESKNNLNSKCGIIQSANSSVYTLDEVCHQ